MRYRVSIRGVVIVLVLALLAPSAALAHDGPARLDLNRQQTSSGAELEIHGVNIAPEQPIVLALIGAGGEYPLGTAIGDVHGDFAIGVRLPAEAHAGEYTVRAFGANRVIVTAPLTLVGSANPQEGEQRDQSELALEPLPQPNPAAQPQAEAQPQRPQTTAVVAAADTPSSISTLLLAIGGLLAVVLALVLAVVPALLRRRKMARGT